MSAFLPRQKAVWQSVSLEAIVFQWFSIERIATPVLRHWLAMTDFGLCLYFEPTGFPAGFCFGAAGQYSAALCFPLRGTGKHNQGLPQVGALGKEAAPGGFDFDSNQPAAISMQNSRPVWGGCFAWSCWADSNCHSA